MKIAILGTRGIPNDYGGFEQFAEYVSLGLTKRGHDVTVYNTHFHPYTQSDYKGVAVRHIFSPEKQMGAAANFIYDFLCLKDALKQDFDIIYEAGYSSCAPSYYLLKKDSPVLITNMDGLEWRRSKWNKATRKLIRFLERIAVKKSDYLISDNVGIQEYYRREFGCESFFIAYGADPVNEFDDMIPARYDVECNRYMMLVARLEPENNIETILDGYLLSNSKVPFLVIGKDGTKYGRFLKNKYENTNIRFVGGIYNKSILDSLRKFAMCYFHGHSVGGTNPSLLEAMASEAYLIANDNHFNRSVLGESALFFTDAQSIQDFIDNRLGKNDQEIRTELIQRNKDLIRDQYSWDSIIEKHEQLFLQVMSEKLQKKKIR